MGMWTKEYLQDNLKKDWACPLSKKIESIVVAWRGRLHQLKEIILSESFFGRMIMLTKKNAR